MGDLSLARLNQIKPDTRGKHRSNWRIGECTWYKFTSVDQVHIAMLVPGVNGCKYYLIPGSAASKRTYA